MVRVEERDYLKKFCKGNGLDIGCGNFKIAGFGIDRDSSCSPDLIADIADIPLKGNRYDYIVSCHVLEHTVYTIRTLKEWHRLLKTGGTLAIAVPNGEYTNTADLSDSSYGHVQLFSIKTLSNFLEFVGFKVTLSTYFNKKETKDAKGLSIIITAKKC